MTSNDSHVDTSQAVDDAIRQDGVYAVIPIKQIADAKQRLSGLLNPEQRTGLFRAMVEDVLAVASGAPALTGCVVVTDDVEVRTLARSYGALVRPEPEDRGLIPAVTETGNWLREAGAAAMVFLPADVPLATTDEIEQAISTWQRLEGDGPHMVIAPAEDLGGSNLLLTAPPGCMRFAFGVDSYRKHLAIARETGLTPVTLILPGIGLDVDFPEDLQALVARREDSSGAPQTRGFLDASGTIKKLQSAPASEGADKDDSVGREAT